MLSAGELDEIDELPERRVARTVAQRRHELAIVRTVGELERQLAAGDAIKVWTERECRERQRLELGTYAVRVEYDRQPEFRWPDVWSVASGIRPRLPVMESDRPGSLDSASSPTLTSTDVVSLAPPAWHPSGNDRPSGRPWQWHELASRVSVALPRVIRSDRAIVSAAAG